jgi:hypothetical protein
MEELHTLLQNVGNNVPGAMVLKSQRTWKHEHHLTKQWLYFGPLLHARSELCSFRSLEATYFLHYQGDKLVQVDDEMLWWKKMCQLYKTLEGVLANKS